MGCGRGWTGPLERIWRETTRLLRLIRPFLLLLGMSMLSCLLKAAAEEDEVEDSPTLAPAFTGRYLLRGRLGALGRLNSLSFVGPPPPPF